MTLEQYIKEFTDKKKLDKFAKDYFNIKLDGRSGLEKLQSEMLEAIKTNDPIKALPDGVELGNEHAPVSETKEPEIKVDEPEIKVEAPEIKVTDKKSDDGLFDFDDGFKPSFQLLYKLNGVPFTLVHFTVTDSLQQIMDGELTFDNVPIRFKRSVRTALYYIKTQGFVMLRESRNSLYKKFKLEDFE